MPPTEDFHAASIRAINPALLTRRRGIFTALLVPVNRAEAVQRRTSQAA